MRYNANLDPLMLVQKHSFFSSRLQRPTRLHPPPFPQTLQIPTPIPLPSLGFKSRLRPFPRDKGPHPRQRRPRNIQLHPTPQSLLPFIASTTPTPTTPRQHLDRLTIPLSQEWTPLGPTRTATIAHRSADALPFGDGETAESGQTDHDDGDAHFDLLPEVVPGVIEGEATANPGHADDGDDGLHGIQAKKDAHADFLPRATAVGVQDPDGDDDDHDLRRDVQSSCQGGEGGGAVEEWRLRAFDGGGTGECAGDEAVDDAVNP